MEVLDGWVAAETSLCETFSNGETAKGWRESAKLTSFGRVVDLCYKGSSLGTDIKDGIIV